MKIGCILSIFILLFIFQFSAAVFCPFGSKSKECPGVCVMYSCKTNKTQSGCQDDFYRDCKEFENDVESIKKHNSTIL
uniref:Uncharacterized protein n=1 Tax=Panagrolaimus superbus TaxID=310955 RepID=A0A914XU27_9BILA